MLAPSEACRQSPVILIGIDAPRTAHGRRGTTIESREYSSYDPLSPELGCDVANTTGGGPRPTTLPVGAAEHTSIPTPFWWHPGGGQARSQTKRCPSKPTPRGGNRGGGTTIRKVDREHDVGKRSVSKIKLDPHVDARRPPAPRTPRHLWSLSFLYTQCNHPHWSAKEA